jgi:hypothetical protein
MDSFMFCEGLIMAFSVKTGLTTLLGLFAGALRNCHDYVYRQ